MSELALFLKEICETVKFEKSLNLIHTVCFVSSIFDVNQPVEVFVFGFAQRAVQLVSFWKLECLFSFLKRVSKSRRIPDFFRNSIYVVCFPEAWNGFLKPWDEWHHHWFLEMLIMPFLSNLHLLAFPLIIMVNPWQLVLNYFPNHLHDRNLPCSLPLAPVIFKNLERYTLHSQILCNRSGTTIDFFGCVRFSSEWAKNRNYRDIRPGCIDGIERSLFLLLLYCADFILFIFVWSIL